MSFAGKVVVVTGASMGIGEAIAEAFANEGAHLVLAARSADLLQDVAARLAGRGGRILTVTADVTSQTDMNRLVEQAVALTGRVDVLVNNAGIGVNGPVESLDLGALQRCFDVNLFGAVRAIQAFVPALTGGGTIVQISSVLGKFAVPYSSGYAASKHALGAISDALRVELVPRSIQVLSVYPGSTESNFRANSLGAVNMPKVRPRRVPASLVGRKVVAAVRHGRRDLYITLRDRLMCWLGTRLPGLADWVLTRAYKLKPLNRVG